MYSVVCSGKTVNDMKMLYFLAGELSNSASYFSTFGNVNIATSTNCKGAFGPELSNTWQQWAYCN